MKFKSVVLMLISLLIVGCQSSVKPEEPEIKFTYQITRELEFYDDEPLDFSDILIGNFDSYELGIPQESVGDHTLTVTLIKNDQEKVIGIPYTIRSREPSDNYFLKELSIKGFDLEPAFTLENDYYALRIPDTTTSFTVSAQTDNKYATIVSGLGLIENPGWDFRHGVLVEAENGEQWWYFIDVEFYNTAVEMYNGMMINYPDSQLASIRLDYLTLVNKEYRLWESYVPQDLVSIDPNYLIYNNGTMLRQEAHDQYIKMREAAASEGLQLNVSTCYRSYDFQRTLYTNYLGMDSQEVVDTYSARPGHSEHQLGLACDFASGLTNDLHNFTNTAEEIWMRENAVKFGFILRFPQDKTDITGYQYESWHYRYVGVKEASKIKESGLVLEEYLK